MALNILEFAELLNEYKDKTIDYNYWNEVYSVGQEKDMISSEPFVKERTYELISYISSVDTIDPKFIELILSAVYWKGCVDGENKQ